MTTKTATVTIRPATDADDLDALNVGNFNWWGADKQRELFRNSPPDVPKIMLIGELDGVPVGYAHGVGAPIAAHGYGITTLFVLPHGRKHGIGRQLFDQIVPVVRDSGVPGLMALVEDDDTVSLDVVRRWGMVDHGHHFESRLDLRTLTDETIERAVAPAREMGYVIDHLSEDTDDATWRATHTFVLERFADSPDARDGGGEMPYDIFRTFAPEPWYVLLAHYDGQPAGVTVVTERPDGERRVNTFFTGVSPDHRGRKLSTALKAAHARQLRDAGWHDLWTQNMEINAPILAANARLGFERIGGYHDMGLAF